MMVKRPVCFIIVLAVCICGSFMVDARAERFKVLVVASYDGTAPFQIDMMEGISSVLSDACEIETFYMNTKKEYELGPQKAKQAYDLYKEFQPDGVITMDDNAQSMFVVPYLKGKEKTPVIFCGVNAEPKQYGFPTDTISGTLERIHILESISFTKALIPSIKSVGYMVRQSPTGTMIQGQVNREKDSYPATSGAFELPGTLKQALAMAAELKNSCDALYVGTMVGIKSDDGTALTEADVIPQVVKAFAKPTFTDDVNRLGLGVLCAVVQLGREQGKTAGDMLLKAMRGTPVARLPITRNRKGKRYINVTALKELGLKPKASALAGVELVTTKQN